MNIEDIQRQCESLSNEELMIDGDIHKDLSLFEKILFFFIFIPRFYFLILRDYRKKKYVLKLWQAGYYFVSGGVSFLSIILFEKYLGSLLIRAIIWLMSFFVAYIFNISYYKPKIIRRLSARTYTQDT